MALKLSKQDQLDIIERLRYGPNWQRIKRDLLHYQYSPVSCLKPQSELDRSIKYEIVGRKEKQSVSQSYVEQKISKYKKATEIDNDRNHRSKRCLENEEYDYFYEIQNRYFASLSKDQACLFCLCSHRSSECSHSKICTACFTLGHSFDSCKQNLDLYRCPNCQRDHIKDMPITCYSLTRGRDDKKALFPTDCFYGLAQILCMNCRKHGHLICSTPPPY